MASPDWDELAEKYVFPYIKNRTKDFSSFFKPNAKNQIHNQVFNMELEYFRKRGYKTKKAKKDLHQMGIVKHADKMLPHIQSLLLKEGVIVRYNRNGKEVVRNNIKWSENELNQAIDLLKKGLSIKAIGKALGRSYASTYSKLHKIFKVKNDAHNI